MTEFKVFGYNTSLVFFSCLYSTVLNNSNVVDSVIKVCIVTISDHFSSSYSPCLSIYLQLPLNGMGCYLQYVQLGLIRQI